MRSYRVARRAFLRGSAAAALLYPLLRNLEAQAQGAPAPLRFLIIHRPLGTVLDRWRPATPGRTFTLPELSAPFEPLRSSMVLIDGLNIVSRGPGGASDAAGDKTHEGGMVGLMTGVPSLGRIGQQDHVAGGPSIDQLFLERSPLLGGSAAAADARTRYPSLQLAADIRADRNEVAPRVMSYRPSVAGSNLNNRRQPLYPVTQPLSVYNSYFKDVIPGGGDPGNAAAVLAQQKSVLDFMRSDLARLRTLVPSEQTVKLDVYADAVQQLESSLTDGGEPPTGSCMQPAQPPSFEEAGGFDPNFPELFPSGAVPRGVDYYVAADPTKHPHQDLGRLQLALIRTAFACDYSRVATFMWSPGTNQVVFPGAFGGAQMIDGQGGGVQLSSHHPPSHDTRPAVVDWVAQVNKWYASQTAEALLEFAGQLDVDGNNLLDNTVVVFVTEVARAHDHDFRNAPWVVFGGANTRIDGGQYLKVSDGPLSALTGGNGNRPVNDVWLALAPIFGIDDLTALGPQGTMYTGPLPGLVKPA
ncbi:MAG TPA: DUF1552 domain-containing protein [Polyangiaceae bacterium]